MATNKKSKQAHLDSVTAEALQQWQETAFTGFASFTGSNGRVVIGVNGFGQYVVHSNLLGSQVFDDPHEAIESYNNLYK